MAPPKHPVDANLPVTRAAAILGVHPNTVRAWSDRGRLTFYRINERGDRRYRLADLRAFLVATEQSAPRRSPERPLPAPSLVPLGRDLVEERTRPGEVRLGYTRFVRIGGAAGDDPEASDASPVDTPDTAEAPRQPAEVSILAELVTLVRPGADPLAVMTAAADLLRDRAGHDLVAVFELRDGTLHPRVARGVGASRLAAVPADRGLPGIALSGRPALLETTPPPHVEEWLAPGRLLHGRIAAPIRVPGAATPWGLLVVADEGSHALGTWAAVAGAVAGLLALALLLAQGAPAKPAPAETPEAWPGRDG